MIRKFISESRKKGYDDEVIRNSLLEAGFDSGLIEKELRKSYWWILMIVIIIILGIVAIFYLDNSCESDSDCSRGYCLEGKCAVNIGMLNCEKNVVCDSGYDCYKCLSASAGI